jgi:ammonium transporter, Amt family
MCYTMVTVIKKRFGYDDALEAFGVHGAGGTLGAVLYWHPRHQRGR